MGRKRKTELEKLSSGEPSNDEDTQPIEVEIEGHAPEEKSFRDRLTEKLKDVVTNEEGSSDGRKTFEELSPSGKWSRLHPKGGRKPKDQSNLQEDFSTLVTSVFVLVVAAWNAPETVKPNNDEVNGLSFRVTRIILRHVDLSGRITADVLDLIGIIAIGASYYSRVAPDIKRLNGSKPNTQTIEGNKIYVPSDVSDETRPWVTPIEQADPNMKNWLDHQANEEEGME